MAVIIGSARIAEDGTIHGAKGDQTGKEVAQENYYRHRFDWFVLRCKDPNKALMLSYDMASACNNPAFGYSQNDRYSGLYEAKKVGYNAAKVSTSCNVDCSSLVRLCLAYAGYEVGDFYTGNEYSIIMETDGFDDVTEEVDLDTGEGLYSGDILVSQAKGHTAIVTQGKDPLDLLPEEHITPCPVGEGEAAVYRMYNPTHEEHFITAAYEEADALLGLGWKSEGVAFIVPKESDTAVFRMNASKHVFITDIKELHILVENGWHFEGVAFHSGGNIPVYRIYNPSNGDHVYTSSEQEKDDLLGLGWSFEGIAFFALRR